MIPSVREGNFLTEDSIPFGRISSDEYHEMNNTEEMVNIGNKQTRMTDRIQTFKTKTFWLILLGVLLCIFVLLFTVFVSLWGYQRNKLQVLPCLSPQCVQAAANVLNSIDEQVSPCDNFFAYACNNWIHKNHIPTGQNTWSTILKMTTNVAHFTREMLENHTEKNSSRGLQIAQAYYESCMNTSLINHLGFEPLYRQLRRFFGGWALLPETINGSRLTDAMALEHGKFDLTQFYMEASTIYGATPLFMLSVSVDSKNTSVFLIDISQANICLNRENYLNESDPLHGKKTQTYRAFMRNYSLLLGVPEENLSELDKVYEFEKEIALHTESLNDRDPEKNPELTTLDNVTKECPVLDWHRLVSKIFEPLNYTVSSNETVALSDASHFKERCKVFKKYLSSDEGIRTIHNAAVWLFLWKTVSKMPNSVLRELEDFKEAESGLKIPAERWSTCVTETHALFSTVVDRVFIKKMFNEKSQDDVLEMIHEIKEAFKENFATVSWMDKDDKVKAVGKVSAMRASVGHPANLYDPAEEERMYGHMKPVNPDSYLENYLEATHAAYLVQLYSLVIKDRYRWGLPASTVNAFYNENANHIFFPAGILQSPFYHPYNPRYINFGGIGTVIGHEITHAFDEFGSKRDAQGNLRQWWSQSTREAFDRNSQCMIDQYSNYSMLDINLNGKTTLGENIADNGGIKASYKAFQRLEAKYGTSPTLPGLNFTTTQLFFLTFAQIWCSKHVPQSAVNTILFDVHAVEDYRVIGTLSNIAEFAQAFNCPLGSKMNPSKKCIVW